MNYRSVLQRYMKIGPDGGDGGGGGSTASPGETVTPPSGGDAGGSVSPAPSDGGVGSPPAATPPSPTQNDDPWSALGEADFDAIEIPPQAPPAQQVPPQVPPQQAVPPAQTTPPATQTPPQAPAQVPAAQTTQQPSDGVPAVELSPSDPAGIAAAVEANRQAVEAHLATTRFALTPEEVQEMETDVAAFIPKMMAKVYTEAMIASQRFLAQSVPGMVQRHNIVVQKNNEAETKFFDTHKTLGLDKGNQQHREAAVRIAKLYRAQNPSIGLDQLIADIGPMVAAVVQAQPQATVPPVGGAQVPQAPGTVVRGGVPFRPAVNGGGGVPHQPNADQGSWDALGQDFD